MLGGGRRGVTIGCGGSVLLLCGRACTRTRPAQLVRGAGISLTLLGGGRSGVTVGCGGSVLLLCGRACMRTWAAQLVTVAGGRLSSSGGRCRGVGVLVARAGARASLPALSVWVQGRAVLAGAPGKAVTGSRRLCVQTGAWGRARVLCGQGYAWCGACDVVRLALAGG